nr:homing endonuclease [Leptographium wingfieldii]
MKINNFIHHNSPRNCFNFSTSSENIFNYSLKIYENPSDQRQIIREENNGKIGVYGWVNKLNGKYYIGSGDPLYLRVSDYYQNWYITSRTNLSIVRALSKYGMVNFSLVILEYSNSEDLIKCEQKWIDLLNPPPPPPAGLRRHQIELNLLYLV